MMRRATLIAVALLAPLISAEASAQVTIDFDNLAPGTVVTNQYFLARFFSSPGNHNVAEAAAVGNVLVSGPVGGTPTGIEDTYVSFTYPVNNLSLTAVEPNGSGVVARLFVFENGFLTGVEDLIGLGGPGSKVVDLSAYTNVTRLEIRQIDPDPAEDGVAWDDFTFTPNTAPFAYCTAKVNSAGCTPAIASSGSPSISAGSGFLITATNVIDSSSGILVYSFNGSALIPFQGGTLCIQPTVWRTPLQNSGGSPPCGGTFSLDFNAHIAATPILFAVGQMVWAQYWSRDFDDPTGVNLTDALAFVVGF
jgi:hypothetical protein